MEKKTIILTEENVLDIYKKLSNNESISEEEIEKVKARFFELVDAKI